MATEKERVEIEVVINTKQAVAELQKARKSAGDLRPEIERIAKSAKVSFEAAGQKVKEYQTGVIRLKYYLGELNKEQASAQIKQFSSDVDKSVNSLNKANKATKGFSGSVNSLKIALGAIVSMVIFRSIQFIEESLRKAEEAAKQFQISLINLANAERVLSKSGIEVSMKDFYDTIAKLQEIFPELSEVDATNLVSSIAVLTKDLGLSKDSLEDIMTAIPVLARKSGDSIESVTEQVVNGLANSGRGWKDLGVIVDANVIKQRAVDDGLVASAEAYKNLTAEQQQQVEVLALINILNDSTSDELANQEGYLNSNAAKVSALSSEWEDFLNILGQAVLGVKAAVAPLFISILEGLQDGINGAKAFLVIFQALETSFYAFLVELEAFRKNPIAFIQNIGAFTSAFANVFSDSLEEGFNRMFSGKIPAGAPEWFKKVFGGYENSVDTPTAIQPSQDIVEPIDTTELGFQDLIDDLEELSRKSAEAKAEFDQDWAGGANVDVNVKINSSAFNQLGREVQDYVIDVQRTLQDYAIKEADIRKSANQKIADIQTKARQDQLNDEAKFQEQLRQLREKYLFSLEDALRDRDARQVLRLKRQYEMDKTALENENALRQKERNADTQAAIAAAVAERDERLRLLDEERNLKLQRMEEDFNLKRQREEEDHALEMEDIQRRINERLEEFAIKAAEELGLREESAQAIYDALFGYFGSGQLIDSLYQHSIESGVQAAQALSNLVSNVLNSMATMQAYAQSAAAMAFSAPVVSYTGANNIPSIGAQANGGLYYANKPTHALFGEAGGEFASFIPESKLRSFASSSQGNASVGNGANGSLSLQLLLSPDLEAKIIDSTLSEVSTTIERVRGYQ